MVIIRNGRGEEISRSKNMRQLRRHAGELLAATVEIVERKNGGGILRVLFENGDSCKTNFASFTVLYSCVKRWYNLRHAELIVYRQQQQQQQQTGTGP